MSDEDDFEDDEDYESDLDVDYEASELSDEEIERKLSNSTMDSDQAREDLAKAEAESDYLLNEKNKRYHERKEKNDKTGRK